MRRNKMSRVNSLIIPTVETKTLNADLVGNQLRKNRVPPNVARRRHCLDYIDVYVCVI